MPLFQLTGIAEPVTNRGTLAEEPISSTTASVTDEAGLSDTSSPYISCKYASISRTLTRHVYSDRIRSSNPLHRVWCLTMRAHIVTIRTDPLPRRHAKHSNGQLIHGAGTG